MIPPIAWRVVNPHNASRERRQMQISREGRRVGLHFAGAYWRLSSQSVSKVLAQVSDNSTQLYYTNSRRWLPSFAEA